MEITPTSDQALLIRQAIEAGRIDSPERAGQEAMALWEDYERRRADILAKVDAGEASVARGDGISITRSSMRELAECVKHRGRLRLESETASRG
jgi:hypothetical protein